MSKQSCLTEWIWTLYLYTQQKNPGSLGSNTMIHRREINERVQTQEKKGGNHPSSITGENISDFAGLMSQWFRCLAVEPEVGSLIPLLRGKASPYWPPANYTVPGCPLEEENGRPLLSLMCLENPEKHHSCASGWPCWMERGRKSSKLIIQNKEICTYHRGRLLNTPEDY